MGLRRRDFLRLAATSAGSAALVACGAGGLFRRRKARVVVIGGGFGGATVAKYLRMWDSSIEVTLVEREPVLVSCAISNLVIGGSKTLDDITLGYETLRSKYGVNVLRAEALGIDPGKQMVTTNIGVLSYDRLVISPGIDFMYDTLPGLQSAEAQKQVPHAWKAGLQTAYLRQQLEAMPDGGVYALGIPGAPYRCPAAPYERVCQAAFYFRNFKPGSKIIVLDANPEITSKKSLFTRAWAELYPGMVDYRPNSPVEDVDVAARTIRTGSGQLMADVLNIIPPQKAGAVANLAGLVNADNRWCGVDFLTYESKAQKNIHVIGDAISAGLPKTGHLANQTAKICAAAIVALLNGESVHAAPKFADTSYSFVSDRMAMHAAEVYRYDPEKKAMAGMKMTSGVSSAPSEIEGGYALAWAQNIWSDMLR